MTERFLSFQGVRELTSLSETTIRRLIAAGKFPPPMTLTPGRRVFEETLVRRAVQRLIAEQTRAANAARGTGAIEAR